MKVLDDNRCILGECSSGKTQRMLEKAKESGAVVVCKNPEAMRVKAQNYGLFGLRFLRYEDINLASGDKVAIDEIGNFFEFCFGIELDAFTATVEVNPRVSGV